MNKLLICLAVCGVFTGLNAQVVGVSITHEGPKYIMHNATGNAIIGFVLRGTFPNGHPAIARQLTVRRPITGDYTLMPGKFTNESGELGNYEVDSVVFEGGAFVGPDTLKQFSIIDKHLQIASAAAQDLGAAQSTDESNAAWARIETAAQAKITTSGGDQFIARSVARELQTARIMGEDAPGLAKKYAKMPRLHGAPVAFVTDYQFGYALDITSWPNGYTLPGQFTPRVGEVDNCFPPLQNTHPNYYMQMQGCPSPAPAMEWNMSSYDFHQPYNNFVSNTGTGYRASPPWNYYWDWSIDIDCDFGPQLEWWNYYGCPY